jgi:GT2 family glycosyltransferase
MHQAATDPKLVDPAHHHDALERLTLRALSDGDYETAFRMADRRCRISPLAQSHHYALRAEAHYHRGHLEFALDDLSRALALAPNDVAANRRMLSWATGPSQMDAAKRLAQHDHNEVVLVKALEIIGTQDKGPLAALKCSDTTIAGWAAWKRPAKLRIVISIDGAVILEQVLHPEPKHALRNARGHAASFKLQRPQCSAPQLIEIFAGNTRIYNLRVPPNSGDPVPLAAGSEFTESSTVSIIVPVYGDLEATTACLESLRKELESVPTAQAIIVEDATPDSGILSYLKRIENLPSFSVLHNEQNLGFVGSVNRALMRATGDIVLLNADTVVPIGFIQRLRAAALSVPDIGTVAPLSNNGEFTSFPIPNEINRMEREDTIGSIDSVAASVNCGRIVDIPNGTGFCLYITRRCLNAVGSLSETFFRGYMEDVDFCLRAAEFGFRNVCAPNVYVGHSGSRSFGSEKRSLVVQNLGPLEARFPDYRAECAAFMLADPLRQARAAIERTLSPSAKEGVLLVTGPGAARDVALHRARRLQDQGTACLIAEVAIGTSGHILHVFEPDGRTPQSLKFDIPDDAAREDLIGYLAAQALSRVELADLAHTPTILIEALGRLGVPIDLWIGAVDVAPLIGNVSKRQLAGSARGSDSASNAWPTSAWPTTGVAHVRVPCEEARNFAYRCFGPETRISLDAPEKAAKKIKARSTAAAPKNSQANVAFGLLTVVPNATNYQLLKTLAGKLCQAARFRTIVVLGTTLDDLVLMKMPSVHVTGKFETDDCLALLEQHRVTRLLLADREPIFGHPVLELLRRSHHAIAYFDWSFGETDARRDDLPLDPRMPDQVLLKRIATWCRRH